jgi:hypothetical protein
MNVILQQNEDLPLQLLNAYQERSRPNGEAQPRAERPC